MEINDLEVIDDFGGNEENEISEITDISELEDLIKDTTEEEEIEGIQDIESDENNNNNGDENNAYILAKTLKDEGILTFVEDDEIKEVKDANTIAKVINSQVEKMFLNKIKEEYGESGERLFKLKEDGGDITELVKVERDLQGISEIDDDVFESDEDADKSIRVGLITYDLSLKGIDQEEAKQLAQVFVETGKDVEKAKLAKASIEKHLSSLKDKIIATENAKILEKKNESKKFAETLKVSLKEKKEILPSFKLDDKTRNEIYDSILKPSGKVDNKEVNKVEKWISENKIESNIILHYLFNLTDGFANFDSIVSKAKSKAVNELDKKLSGNNFNIETGNQRKDYFGKSKHVVSPEEW